MRSAPARTASPSASWTSATRSSSPSPPPRSGSFASARFFGYRPLAPLDSARTLARFSDGSVALARGAGRPRPACSPGDRAWTSRGTTWRCSRSSSPSRTRLVRYAAGHAPQGAWRTVGEVLDPEATLGAAAGQGWVRSPSGTRERLEGTAPVRLAEQGFYEAAPRRRRWRGRGGRRREPRPPRSRTWRAWTRRRVARSIAPLEDASAPSVAASAPTASERERRQAIWVVPHGGRSRAAGRRRAVCEPPDPRGALNPLSKEESWIAGQILRFTSSSCAWCASSASGGGCASRCAGPRSCSASCWQASWRRRWCSTASPSRPAR